jgi:hypothetical protein
MVVVLLSVSIETAVVDAKAKRAVRLADKKYGCSIAAFAGLNFTRL